MDAMDSGELSIFWLGCARMVRQELSLTTKLFLNEILLGCFLTGTRLQRIPDVL